LIGKAGGCGLGCRVATDANVGRTAAVGADARCRRRNGRARGGLKGTLARGLERRARRISGAGRRRCARRRGRAAGGQGPRNGRPGPGGGRRLIAQTTWVASRGGTARCTARSDTGCRRSDAARRAAAAAGSATGGAAARRSTSLRERAAGAQHQHKQKGKNRRVPPDCTGHDGPHGRDAAGPMRERRASSVVASVAVNAHRAVTHARAVGGALPPPPPEEPRTHAATTSQVPAQAALRACRRGRR
jgi:hypothetical protein